MKNEDDQAEEVEGLDPSAAEDGEVPARIGHTAADSATNDEPEADEPIDDPAEVDYVELVKVHNVRERNEARMIRGMLEAADIPCHVEDDVQDTLDGLSAGHLDGIDIFVPADFAQRARTALREQGVATGVDEGRVTELLAAHAEKALAGDAAARAALAGELAAELRDLRHEILVRLVRRGPAGVDLVRALMREGASGADETPLVNDVAALANQGILGDNGTLLVVDELAKLTRDNSRETRLRAARALGRLRGAGAGGPLVELLRDDDPAVRDEALESLYAISDGETFDFDPDAPPSSQEKAITAWRAWLRDNAGA